MKFPSRLSRKEARAKAGISVEHEVGIKGTQVVLKCVKTQRGKRNE